MEVNSLPLAMWLAAKRSSNKRRTAGINEEPPVRKTWSIAPALIPARSSATSTVAPMRARVGCNPAFEIGTADVRFHAHARTVEMEVRALLGGKRPLQPPNRVIERIAKLIFHHGDHTADRGGIIRCPLQLLQLGQRTPVMHQREAGPVAEIGEMAGRYFQRLAHGRIGAALAQHRQDQLIHDAIVEAIARYTDAGGPERRTAPQGPRRLYPYDRKVAGAAAEIRDQQSGRFGQAGSKTERSAQRLVDIMDFPFEGRKHEFVPPAGKCAVRALPRIADWASHDDAGREVL